jgi:ribosomal protein L24E
VKLFEWFRKLFKRKKPKAVSWTKPYAKSSTVESRISTYPVKPTLTEGKPAHVRIESTPTTPITHPAKYRKFFKKRRQPTTARKLWKPKAKIEDEEEGDVNVIFPEDD